MVDTAAHLRRVDVIEGSGEHLASQRHLRLPLQTAEQGRPLGLVVDVHHARRRGASRLSPRHRRSVRLHQPEDGKAWQDLRKPFLRAVRRAKLDGLWFHDLRRSFVTRAPKAGIPESIVIRMSGHKTRAVFDRYNVVDESGSCESPPARSKTMDAFWTQLRWVKRKTQKPRRVSSDKGLRLFGVAGDNVPRAGELVTRLSERPHSTAQAGRLNTAPGQELKRHAGDLRPRPRLPRGLKIRHAGRVEAMLDRSPRPVHWRPPQSPSLLFRGASSGTSIGSRGQSQGRAQSVSAQRRREATCQQHGSPRPAGPESLRRKPPASLPGASTPGVVTRKESVVRNVPVAISPAMAPNLGHHGPRAIPRPAVNSTTPISAELPRTPRVAGNQARKGE